MPYPTKVTATMSWQDVPTCKSQGLDVEYTMLRGIFMPAGVTQEQVDFYVDLFKKVRELPEWKKYTEDAAFNDTFMTGKEYADWVQKAESAAPRPDEGSRLPGEVADGRRQSREEAAAPRRRPRDPLGRARLRAADRVGGGVVIYDSVRIGAKWASDGPQAGYFPWLTGCALALSGGVDRGERRCGAGSELRGRRVRELGEAQARCSSMLLPTIAFVVLIKLIGIYVASAIFIAGFMMWQGRYQHAADARASRSACRSLVFLLFEMWFLVPLPKGPIERMLGY